MHFLTFIFFSKVLFPLLFVESQKEQIWTFLACKFEISDDTEKQLSQKSEPQCRVWKGAQAPKWGDPFFNPKPNPGFKKENWSQGDCSTFYTRPYPAAPHHAMTKINSYENWPPPTGRRENFRDKWGLGHFCCSVRGNFSAPILWFCHMRCDLEVLAFNSQWVCFILLLFSELPFLKLQTKAETPSQNARSQLKN